MYGLVQNQLHLSSMGDVVSLDYNAVLSVLDLYNVEDKKDVFEDILIMFNTAREIERNKKVVDRVKPRE